MYPHALSLHVGGLAIHLYGVMMALAFLAGLANWSFLGRREHRDFAFCSDLLFWIMVAGVVGARAAYVIADFAAFRDRPLSMLYVWQGGLIYYGGFLGAGLAILVFARLRRTGVAALFDFVITAVPLAHAFGRIGCFLNGCCYGREWHGPLAVRYPPHSGPWCDQVDAGLITRFSPRSAPVHPVQLYEAAANILLYLGLVWLYRRRRRDGTVLAAYLLTYPVLRFWLETLRGDPRMPVLGLSVAQGISVGLFAVGLALLVRARLSAPRTPVPPR